MKKVVLVIVVALVTAIGLLLAAPGFIDWSKHKQQIVSQLHQATGLSYDIQGDLELALLPFPRAMIEGLRVTNPDYHGQTLLVLDRAEASLALAPLFSGQVKIADISLIKPRIHLEIGPNGEKSWMTATLRKKFGQKDDEADSGITDAISLDAIKIKDGSFIYVNKMNGQSHELAGVNLTLRGETIRGPYKLEGDLVYNGYDMTLAASTERLASGEGIPLQAKLALPALPAEISFSGVASAETFEFQGHTSVNTASISKLMAVSGVRNPSAFLDKAFSGEGMLTVTPAAVAFRDARLTYNGTEARGSIVLTGLQDGNKPASLDVELAATGPLDIAKLMPQAQEGKQESFLPETLTLPLDMTAKVKLSAPAVKAVNSTLQETNLVLSFSGRQAEGAVKSVLPGKGLLNIAFELAYASSSRSEKSGAVTLADPVLDYTLDLNAEEGAKTVAALWSADHVKPFLPLVQNGLSARMAGNIKPAIFTIGDGSLKLAKASMALQGSYEYREGRDSVTATVHTEQIDMDQWLAPFLPSTPVQAATQEETPVLAGVKDLAAGLQLPVDIDLSLISRNIRLIGQEFDKADLLAELSGQTLSVQTIELRDKKGNSLLAQGKINNLQTLQGIKLAVDASTPNLKDILSGLNIDTTAVPAAVEDAELVAEVKGNAEKMAFTANLAVMGGTLDSTGIISNVLKSPVFSGLTARIRHPNYVDVVQLFSPGFRSNVAVSKELDVFANMKREGGIYGFTDVQATIGPSTITGNVSMDTQGEKPAVTASLKAGNLPLDKLLGHDAGHKGSARAQSLGQSENVRWSRNAINTDWMHKINLDIDVAAEVFSYGPWEVNNAVLKAELKDGVLTLNPIKGGAFGGQVNLTGKAASSDKDREPLSVESAIGLKDIALESFIRAFSGSRLVQASGNISLDTTISSTGLSPAALIFSLQGKGNAKGSNLVMQGFDLAQLSSLLAQPSSSMTENLTALLDTSLRGGATKFDTLSAAYTIKEGVARFTELKLIGPEAVVTGEGTVNLPLWTVDMSVTVKLAEPADAPPLTVVFKGPLDNPGQTFVRSAMDKYFQNILKQQFQNIISEQLQEKGVLPTPETPAEQPAQQPAAQQQPVEPEDVFRGVLENIIENQ